MKNRYLQQVELLLEVLPLINTYPCFALKGGTAINLFLHNMPRLSVDIDLCYLPIEPRTLFLNNISKALINLSEQIERVIQAKVKILYNTTNRQPLKLWVSKNGVQIKVEPNFILRGNVFGTETKILCDKAQEDFLRAFKITTLSTADIYGGKICAALDRQHPRDLFDVKILLEHQGITDQIRQAFIIYLCCSPRPMGELLNPHFIDFRATFNSEFLGMTVTPMTYEELLEMREKLIRTIKKDLTYSEKQFLLSIKKGEPEWEWLNIPGIENLPALQWKLMNIKNMAHDKHHEAIKKLEEILE